MPATSKAMRRATAIAEHHPEEVYLENKGLLNMSKEQLHDFAKTKEKGLPEHKKPAHHGRHKTSEHAPHGRKPNPRGGY